MIIKPTELHGLSCPLSVCHIRWNGISDYRSLSCIVCRRSPWLGVNSTLMSSDPEHKSTKSTHLAPGLLLCWQSEKKTPLNSWTAIPMFLHSCQIAGTPALGLRDLWRLVENYASSNTRSTCDTLGSPPTPMPSLSPTWHGALPWK